MGEHPGNKRCAHQKRIEETNPQQKLLSLVPLPAAILTAPFAALGAGRENGTSMDGMSIWRWIRSCGSVKQFPETLSSALLS
jgi:hypothetical protein